MYEVVGCGSCRGLWIREGEANTATCPRCGKQHQVDKLRTFASAESVDTAREARSALLVARDRGGDDVAGYTELADEIESAGMPDDVYLTAHGVDVTAATDAGERAMTTPERKRPREIVRAAIGETESATEARIVDSAGEHGLEPVKTRTILAKLVRSGHVVEDDNAYRLL